MRRVGVLLLSATGLMACGGGDEAGVTAPQASALAGHPLKRASSDAPWQELAVPMIQPLAVERDVGPPALKRVPRLLSPQPVHLSLPPLPVEKTGLVLAAAGEAQQVGVARDMPEAGRKALTSLLNWQPTVHGGQVGAISVTSTGAKGVRLGVLLDALPGSARFRIYAQAHPEVVHEVSAHEVMQLLARNAEAGDLSEDGRTWWTPEVAGDEATLELELPRGVPVVAVRVAIPRLSHIHLDDAGVAALKQRGEAGACQLDAVCHAEANAVSDAVARMRYVKGGSSYLCTGTLLNDKDTSTYVPYFITAAHCVADQTTASTLQTDWFFRSTSCNSSTQHSDKRSLAGGAQLLYANSNYDTALMRLNDEVPNGVRFAGWRTGFSQGQSLMGVHHPKGDWLKVSKGVLAGQANCQSSSGGGFSCSTSSTGGYHRIEWQQGITEGGSSGSGLFSAGQLMGVLRGSNNTCASPGMSMYGRFDQAFNDGLKQWLNVAGSTPAPAPAPASEPRSAVYRFYNAKSGAHFYSGSAAERDFVIRSLPDFQYEGTAFYAAVNAGTGLAPVYRFYNRKTSAHFYSISAAERDFVRNQLPEFAYEGPSWYARATAGTGSTPVYRFYNGRSGAHFYTSNAAERDFVLNALPEFHYENVAYHVWATP